MLTLVSPEAFAAARRIGSTSLPKPARPQYLTSDGISDFSLRTSRTSNVGRRDKAFSSRRFSVSFDNFCSTDGRSANKTSLPRR
jgi:hypothetical protein